jgi:hypothetical protein
VIRFDEVFNPLVGDRQPALKTHCPQAFVYNNL